MTRSTRPAPPPAGTPLCVYCRLHAEHPDWRPFCSERCRLLDLSGWLEGEYRVHGADTDPASVPDDEGDDPS